MKASIESRAAQPLDLPAILTLLTNLKLPTAGVEAHLSGFVVAGTDGTIVGCGALERYEADALLRSIAVAEDRRSDGIGGRIVKELLARARNEKMRSVVLLTTTAADYFPRFGFRVVSRDEIPESVKASEEFRGACPETAVAMMLGPG